MTEQLFSEIPPDPNFGLALEDDDRGGVSQWSSGAQRIVQVPAQPTLVEPWTVTGWGITLTGALATTFAGGGTAPFGRLGRLLAAPFLGPVAPSPGGSFEARVLIPHGALPAIETLWDGNQDPPFPFVTGFGGFPPAVPQIGGVIAASFQLQQPITLSSGDTLGFGLWLVPMLVNNLAVLISNVTYNISYEISPMQ